MSVMGVRRVVSILLLRGIVRIAPVAAGLVGTRFNLLISASEVPAQSVSRCNVIIGAAFLGSRCSVVVELAKAIGVDRLASCERAWLSLCGETKQLIDVPAPVKEQLCVYCPTSV